MLILFFSKTTAERYKIENWNDYWTYACNMYQAVRGEEISEKAIPKVPQVTFEDHCYIILNNTVFAATHILRLYDKLLELPEENRPTLYNNLISLEEKGSCQTLKSTSVTMLKHAGQMGCAHPLSESQRKSLNHLNLLNEGEVMAVSGPPGTGKTILLQSVVADLVTQRALLKKDPPIIVASSTINQAVTNIIDSFSKYKDR